MDNGSKITVFCRSLATFVATLHLALIQVFKTPYGYSPVVFACFVSIFFPYFLMTLRIRQLEYAKKYDIAIENRILKFLCRDRYITWNEVHFSLDIIITSINIFAFYVVLSIRAREGVNIVYYLTPAGLSLILIILFLADAVFAFLSIKRHSRPMIPHKPRKKMDKVMNVLAERLILIQLPLLFVVTIWHSFDFTNSDAVYKHVGMALLAANFIQYPLMIMICAFVHGRMVQCFQRRLGRYGLHVYGLQYTILLVISGMSLSSLILNLELIIKFRGDYLGYFYLIAPYLTFMVSLAQAFALAGHPSWKNFNAKCQIGREAQAQATGSPNSAYTDEQKPDEASINPQTASHVHGKILTQDQDHNPGLFDTQTSTDSGYVNTVNAQNLDRQVSHMSQVQLIQVDQNPGPSSNQRR